MEKKPVGYEETKDKALRLLTFRAHSEYELTGKLKHFGAREEDIEKTLDFCRRYNFVNDLQYAKSKAKDLQNLNKFGKRRIEAEHQREFRMNCLKKQCRSLILTIIRSLCVW